MIVQSFLGGRPGLRIDDYRNSTPRHIKVLAVGKNAAEIIARHNTTHRDNVLTVDEIDPTGARLMDEPVNGITPNAVVVIYENGDEVRFPFLAERTASMLSFVVLETAVASSRLDSKFLRDIRAVADLYVTTSDHEFVEELIGNLAS